VPPEDIVRNLPWRVWTGTGWEKHEGGEDANTVPDHVSAEIHLEEGFAAEYASPSQETSIPTETSILMPPDEDTSTSLPATPPDNQPWFESQLECAICLSEFAKGDKVRVLPCHHIFHLHEVDEWLIQRKKLCPVCKADVTQPAPPPPVRLMLSQTDSTLPPQRPTPTIGATERTSLLSHHSEEHN